MSMLTAQVENLRIMARLVRDYDYREISRALREAADTIADLRGRLNEQTCELEINTDMTAVKCSRCGYVVPKGTNLTSVKYCAGCGRQVV